MQDGILDPSQRKEVSWAGVSFPAAILLSHSPLPALTLGV
jgi:hypothetical protein